MSVMSHLPQVAATNEPEKPIQVKVAESFKAAVAQACEEDGITMTDAVVAGLTAYLEERGRRPRKKGS